MCLGRGSGEHPVCKGRPGQRLSRRPWVGVLEAKGPSTRQRKVGLVRPGEPKWHTRKRRQPPRYGGLGAKPRLARRDYEFSALDHGWQRHPPRLGRVLTAGQWAILPVFGPKTRAFSLPGVQRYPTNSAMQALFPCWRPPRSCRRPCGCSASPIQPPRGSARSPQGKPATPASRTVT